MKKLLLLAASSAILLAGCASEAQAVNLIFSVNAVPGDAHYEGMMKFKEVIEADARANITVDTFHSGSLFKQDQELGAVKSGQADIVYLSAPWLTTDSPWIGMFTAGYVFQSYEHMTFVMNGDIGQSVFARVVQEQGVRPLAAFYLGTRQISLKEDKQIRTPADLKGVNLRMPNSPAWLFLGRALGANPTPIAFSELYLALQTGTVDGQDNPLPTVRSAKFYEVQKSINITNHLVDSVWPVINEGRWQSLNQYQRDAILRAVEAARKTTDELNVQREKELVAFFESQGLKVYRADLKAFSDHVLSAYLNDKTITKDWDLNLLEQIRANA
jgi:tripartite ATP-independent transporter DctP family solute receptor